MCYLNSKDNSQIKGVQEHKHPVTSMIITGDQLWSGSEDGINVFRLSTLVNFFHIQFLSFQFKLTNFL